MQQVWYSALPWPTERYVCDASAVMLLLYVVCVLRKKYMNNRVIVGMCHGATWSLSDIQHGVYITNVTSV